MSTPLLTVKSGEKISEINKLMNQPGHDFWKKKRLVVVDENGKLIGVLDRVAVYDLVTHAKAGDGSEDKTAGDVCSKSLISVRENEMAYEALVLMSLHDSSGVVVVNESDVAVGYVSRGDLMRAQKRKIFDETVIQNPRYSFKNRLRWTGWDLNPGPPAL